MSPVSLKQILLRLGGRDNPHFVKSGQDPCYVTADPSIIVTDVLQAGPAVGLLQ